MISDQAQKNTIILFSKNKKKQNLLSNTRRSTLNILTVKNVGACFHTNIKSCSAYRKKKYHSHSQSFFSILIWLVKTAFGTKQIALGVRLKKYDDLAGVLWTEIYFYILMIHTFTWYLLLSARITLLGKTLVKFFENFGPWYLPGLI